MEAGNNLEQSVALVAAANKVVQDPNSVGSALRTISLRLRGTSVEVLQEMGEETDGVVESVSKMQEKIKALTGVDILTETGAYKETYTILNEIGQVWEDMNDIDQAALLELMAGKNRANTLAAILGNMEDLEGAYKSALNAEGSALRENEAYLNSIQGRIDLFTNSLQTMWMNAVDSDIVKFIVDLGTAAVQLVDTLGLIPTLLAGFAGFSAIKTIFNTMSDYTGFIGGAIKSGEILTATNQKLVASTIAEQVTLDLTNSSLVKYAITSGIVTAEQVAQMTTTELLGVAFLGLAAKIKAAAIAMAKFLFTTPVGWSILAVTAITGVIAAYNAWGPTHENFVEKLDEETDSLKSVQSELQSVQSELETTRDRIEELESKGSLSFVEEEELNRLKQQTAELERQEEILLAQEQRAKNKQIDTALKAAETDPNLQNRVGEISTSYAAAYGMKDTITDESLGNAWEINLYNLQKAKEDLDKANAELSKATPETEESEYNRLKKNVEDAQARVDQYNESIDNLNKAWETEYGEVGYVENATREEDKAWSDFYREHQDYLTQQAFINGTFNKADVLNSTFGVYATDAAKEFKEKFESGVKDGKNPVEVIEGLLSDANYSSAFAGLADQFGITLDDIKNYFTQVGEFATPEVAESITAIGQAYSTLSASVEKYTSINDVLNESIYDNVEISKEQYDALNELIGSEEEFVDCIDTSNGYVVKNTALLRKLVNQKKQEQKATIQEAKAYSQLQYKNTVGQIGRLISSMEAEVKATGFVSNATLENIAILQEQLGAIRQTIQQYSLLELKLSDAANAYAEFEAAKQRDAELNYGDSMIEAIQTINEGFKTGKVGTEAFQAAVDIVVPESAYANIDNIEQRMIAIHDYIDRNPLFADWFTIDDSGFSITIDNINSFIDDAHEAGLFTSDSSGDFFLTDAIKNAEEPLKEFADQLGEAFGTEVTEGSVLAMLTELEKYDASWGNIITDLTTTPLDRAINDATDALADALIAQEEFIKSGGDLNSDEYAKLEENVSAARDELDKASQVAMDNAQTYTQVEAVLKGMTGEVKYTQEQADALAKSLGLIDENGHITINTETGAIELTQAQLDILNERLTGLQKPTILDIQLAYDKIDEQIKGLENRNPKILAELQLTNSNDEEIQNKIDELKSNKNAIELVYNITTTSTEQATGNMEKLASWETNGINIIIKGDSSSLKEAVDEANNLEVKDKEPTIAMQGVSVALSEIGSIDSAVSALPDSHTIDISVNYTTFGTPPVLSGGGGADGNFHISGGAFAGGTVGAPRTEVALTGELGPEMVVRNGRWFTVGENGAEFTQIKKGDIIFNHKQTEDLLSKGYVTSRGKAYSGGTTPSGTSGTAYYRTFGGYVGDNDVFKNGSSEWVDPWTNTSDSLNKASSSISKAADALSDSSDEFSEVFDWIEVRLEEIEETLGLLNAQLENATYYNQKNNIIDDIINTNKNKLDNLEAGYAKYAEYAAELLTKVPEEYRDAVQKGAIDIEGFVDEADESTLEAINNYREWAQKAADLKQQAVEVITEIRDLAIQKFDNAYEAGSVRATVEDSQTGKLQNAVDYDEERGLVTSDAYYIAMMENSNKKIEYLTNARKAMQEELDAAVKAGQIVRGSNEWYELIDQMYQIDSEIDEATIELEEFQNAINDIYWENFDQLINRIDYLKDETQNLIDLMDSDDLVVDPQKRKYEGGTVEYWTAEDVDWTNEGLASLGLYAQQMEIAEYKARQYAEAIDDLTKEYKAGHYSESEYYEKLNELKDSQYESIEAYEDAKDAIVDLNKARIDSIKNGIDKEIEAYEELINAKKELLDSEKDAYDFQKGVMEQQKEISDVERKLAALAYDNSISAAAKRAQLEAELAELKAGLDETYYDRSVEEQQNALDKELENFQKEKDDEVAKMEEYLEDIKQVVADSLTTVQANASGIYDTLTGKAEEYNLTLSESILTPWQNGSLAVSDYQETFDTAISSTMDQLDALKNKWQEVIDKMTEAGNVNVDVINKENANYAAATPTSTVEKKQEKSSTSSKHNTYTVQRGDNLWGIAEKQLGSGSRWQEIYNLNKDIIANPDVIQPGWNLKIPKYAKGTLSSPKDQWAILDELGEELELIPDGNGRLAYMKKGTSVVPADLTTNLMGWGRLDPSTMLEQNKPEIGVSPSVVNNTTEIHIDASVGELLHVEHLDGNNPAELTKIVDKAWDKRMKELNGYIRRYTSR